MNGKKRKVDGKKRRKGTRQERIRRERNGGRK